MVSVSPSISSALVPITDEASPEIVSNYVISMLNLSINLKTT